MEEGSYHYHLVVFEETVDVESGSLAKRSMRWIAEGGEQKTGTPENDMSFDDLPATRRKYDVVHTH